MENNENLIVVRQLPIIEEKLRQVKADVEARVGLALSMDCTEETRQSVKAARAELSKEFNELEARRKEVKAAVLAPYEDRQERRPLQDPRRARNRAWRCAPEGGTRDRKAHG